jgi:hypothetical protein
MNMEMKDLIGLIFTFLIIVFLQFLGRPKKRADKVVAKVSQPPIKKGKTHQHKHGQNMSSEKINIRSVTVRSSYHEKKEVQKSRYHALFQNKKSLRDAFVMQEIIKRPYE